MSAQPRLKPARRMAGDAALPFHAQVRESLRARIVDGSWQPGQQMPSEHEMTALFAVSRITVRQALQDLQNEGLIHRVHGKGTFVSRPHATQDLMRLQSFGEAMRPQGYDTFNKLVSVRETVPPAGVAQRLGLPRGAQVSEITRVRYLNQSPVSLDTSHFALPLGRRLAQQDLASRDLFVILEQDFGLRLGHADMVIGSRLADDAQARLLDLAPGAALLHVDRLTCDEQGEPLVCEHLFNRGDVYQYHLRVDRKLPSRPG